MTEVAEHLGGYIPGGDPATWFPELWTWLYRDVGVRSVLDVGCGEGRAMDFFYGLGCDVLGVDGVPQARADVIVHDFEHDGALYLAREFDLCWCCEFVEHVSEACVPNFMTTFAHANLVVMTHGFPGQPGWHHVNCQLPAYWLEKMAAQDFVLDTELTARAKEFAALNTFTWEDALGSHRNHFLRSGLVFRR